MDKDVSVTLIGTRLARVGEEFVFNGPAGECKGCKLRKACMNLKVGRRYRVVSIRKTDVHECSLHDGGVIAVEVIEPPIMAAVESKKVRNGSKISFVPPKCDELQCSNYSICHPLGLKKGDRCTISNVLGDLPSSCGKGYALKMVELKRK
jgi:hypothetical protein